MRLLIVPIGWLIIMLSCLLEEKNWMEMNCAELFQVSHTRKKVIYFPFLAEKMFSYHFLQPFLLLFSLNQYNRVHEVLCILCVFLFHPRSVSSSLLHRLHMLCVQSEMIKLSIFIYSLLFLDCVVGCGRGLDGQIVLFPNPSALK
jgi:hypothetical protein